MFCQVSVFISVRSAPGPCTSRTASVTVALHLPRGPPSSDDVRAGTFDPLPAPEAEYVLNSETFLRRIRTIRVSPQRAVYDIVEFRDGRTFERTAEPQTIDGECVGMVAH